MRSVSRGGIICWILVVMFGLIIAVVIPRLEPTAVESTMTLEEGKEIATALNQYVWPDGAIIHKRLGNGWVCVEIDGHHLLVHNRGNSTFGVAVDSCIEE